MTDFLTISNKIKSSKTSRTHRVFCKKTANVPTKVNMDDTVLCWTYSHLYSHKTRTETVKMLHKAASKENMRVCLENRLILCYIHINLALI